MILNEPKGFTIDVQGSVTKTDYRGVFKMKPYLSHRDRLRMDEYRRQLLGSQADGASEAAIRISEIFAKIWTHLTDAPTWWREGGNGVDLADEEPVVQVLQKIIDIEKEALGALTKDAEKAKEDLAEIAKK